jgi:hypothetical protein
MSDEVVPPTKEAPKTKMLLASILALLVTGIAAKGGLLDTEFAQMVLSEACELVHSEDRPKK